MVASSMTDTRITVHAITVSHGGFEMSMEIDEDGQVLFDAGADGDYAIPSEMVPHLLALLEQNRDRIQEVEEA